MAKYVEPSGYFNSEMKKALENGKKNAGTKPAKKTAVKKTASKKK